MILLCVKHGHIMDGVLSLCWSLCVQACECSCTTLLLCLGTTTTKMMMVVMVMSILTSASSLCCACSFYSYIPHLLLPSPAPSFLISLYPYCNHHHYTIMMVASLLSLSSGRDVSSWNEVIRRTVSVCLSLSSSLLLISYYDAL